jgi:hypothetical protein
MNAYLIDPRNRSVTLVQYSGDYRQIYTHIGATTFTGVYVAVLGDDGEPDPKKPYDVFVDDEGLINGNPDGWFTLRGYPGVLRGRGLVLGHNDEGDSVEPVPTLTEVTRMVGFPSDWQVRMMMMEAMR